MANKILIYDGDCTYCRGFISVLERIDKGHQFSVLQYSNDYAQSLLKAQFGTAFGFSMYLFESDEVSWGKEAAKRIVERLNFPRFLAKVAFKTYPYMLSLVSKLTRRDRKVCGPECFEQHVSKEGTAMWVATEPEARELLTGMTNSSETETEQVGSL